MNDTTAPAASARPSTGRGVGDEVRALMRVVAVVALVVLALTVLTRAWLLLRIDPRLDRLQTAALELDTLHVGMVDQETGARGYLATGSPVFLQPLQKAAPAVAVAERQVATALPGGALAGELMTLEQARQRWVDVWLTRAIDPAQQKSLGAGGTTRTDQQRLAGFMAEGKTLFDAYRTAHLALEADIAKEVRRDQRLERQWLLWGGVAIAVISLVTVLVSLLARRRMTRRITGPIEALATDVARISAGDLDTGIEITDGPAELTSLGRDIGAMAALLRDQLAVATEREEEARRHAHRLDVVLTAAREVAGSLSLRYVLSSVATAALQLGHDQSRIWLLDEDARSLMLSFDTAAGRAGPGVAEEVAVGSGVVGRTAKYGRPTGPEPVEEGDGSVVAVPLIVGGRVVGVLECRVDHAAPALSEQDFEVLEALAGHAAGAVSAAQLHEQVVEHAVTDALTLLPNRRAFDAEFRTEVERATRYSRPLSVVSIDLDHFKALNDRHGHAFGDLALQQVAEVLRTSTRESERIYRLGGEELAVVCPETSARDAAALAERLRRAVEGSAGPGGPRVTASFGIAQLPAHAADATALLAAADAALYAAKRAGRNQVAVSALAAQRVAAGTTG